MKKTKREHEQCTAVTKCRMCRSSRLAEYLDLGHMPPADQFLKPEDAGAPQVAFPLRVLLCRDCGLSQLSHVVDPVVLYQNEYPYEQATNKTARAHWDGFAAAVSSRLGSKPNDLVVDIGSNTGTLLGAFKNAGYKVVGVDPAPNIVALANAAGVKTYCSFYGKEIAQKVAKQHGRAAVIVGSNVFAHIDDLDEVMKANAALLDKNGVFIFESPHMGPLVEHLEYDTIYHEHLSYLSLAPVVKFVQRFGLEVFAVEESPMHGGSFRVYIAKKGTRTVDASVEALLAKEQTQRIHDLGELQNFARRVQENRNALRGMIQKLNAEGKKVAVVSAPAKGMTLLNYAGLTKHEIVFATEKSKLKLGRLTPGGNIPIVPDSALIEQEVDYALLLAWNFASDIIRNNEDFVRAGGKFIIPIPEPRIVEGEKVMRLEPNFSDARGEIRDILAGIAVDAVTCITSKKGAIRGNHYHEHTEQWDYVISGSLELASQVGAAGKVETTVLKAGDLAYHPADERHALKALEDTVFLSITRGPRRGKDYEKDVIRLREPILR